MNHIYWIWREQRALVICGRDIMSNVQMRTTLPRELATDIDRISTQLGISRYQALRQGAMMFVEMYKHADFSKKLEQSTGGTGEPPPKAGSRDPPREPTDQYLDGDPAGTEGISAGALGTPKAELEGGESAQDTGAELNPSAGSEDTGAPNNPREPEHPPRRADYSSEGERPGQSQDFRREGAFRPPTQRKQASVNGNTGNGRTAFEAAPTSASSTTSILEKERIIRKLWMTYLRSAGSGRSR